MVCITDRDPYTDLAWLLSSAQGQGSSFVLSPSLPCHTAGKACQDWGKNNVFKAIQSYAFPTSISVIFVTLAIIIASRNHRWCLHIVQFPDSHCANETGLPVRPVSTDQVVIWRDRWAFADRWQDDLENLPPFLGSGSSWQVLFH